MPKGAVKAMYIDGVIVDINKLGVVADHGRDGGKGIFYDILIDGEKVRYNLASDVQTGHVLLPKGTTVKFSLVSGKIGSLDKVRIGIDEQYVAKGEVEERGADYVKVNGKYYYMDEDTMIVDVVESTKKIVRNVGRGEYIKIYTMDSKGIVDLIVIDKESAVEIETVKDAVAVLPAVDQLTLADKARVDSAKSLYDALSDSQKESVKNEKAYLDAAVAKIAELQNAKDAADAVVALIDALPAAADLTLDKKADVDAAKAAYDALPDVAKAQVSSEVVDKLNAAVAKIDELQAAKEEADKVVALINGLKPVDELTKDDKEAVQNARAAYDKLTDAQKAFVSEEVLAKLKAAEARIAELESDPSVVLTVTAQYLFGAIKGNVKDSEGNAVADATISIKDAKGEVVATATTDENGEFGLTQSLSIGEYTVEAVKDNASGSVKMIAL
jgi:hypothetical protein